MTIHWTTACPDWKERIVRGETLIPFPPLFPHEAERALEVFKSLRAVDVQGQPTMGEICRQWVFDLVACIFGAYDDENGRQLIRYFLLLIAKKNGKSTLAAGIMITALVLNWRMSAELYILSPTKEIANNSFFPARDMVLTHDTLRQMLRIQENFRQITHRNTNSILKVIAADSETVGGKKTSYLLIDELWQFGASAGAAAMLREAMGGLASRPEGFVMAATTQGNSQPAGIFDEWLTKFREIRDGKRVDQRSLGLLYEFPEEMIKDESYKDTRNFYIVNPNLGVSVDEEYLFDQLFDAENATNKGQLINFYAKHLNVQVGMALRADSWAGALVWERGIETGLTLDAIIERSEVITIGIDGGGLDDLLGIAIIGREKGTKRWLGWAHALISDIGIERRKANIENYDQFETDGNLTKFTYRPPVEGQEDLNAENIRYVVDLVRRIHDLGLLAQVGAHGGSDDLGR